MNDVASRLATADDFGALAAITNHYIRTTAIHFGYDDVTADELRDLWRQHGELYPWIVATIDDTVVGYAKAGTYRARAAYRFTVETGIYLRADHCGKGFGLPLYRRLLDVLRAQGFHSAIGGIALPNEASVRLHERLGFLACGIVRAAGRKFEAWHDVGFWQLALREGPPPDRMLSPAEAFAATAAR